MKHSRALQVKVGEKIYVRKVVLILKPDQEYEVVKIKKNAIAGAVPLFKIKDTTTGKIESGYYSYKFFNRKEGVNK